MSKDFVNKAERPEEGFKVIDRRKLGRDTSEGSLESQHSGVKSPEDSAPQEVSRPQRVFAGEDAFAQFLLSLATQAYFHLGKIPGPDGKLELNLALAQQTIDILGLLETKTKSNLSPQEDALITQLLAELRLHYVEATKNAKPT